MFPLNIFYSENIWKIEKNTQLRTSIMTSILECLFIIVCCVVLIVTLYSIAKGRK